MWIRFSDVDQIFRGGSDFQMWIRLSDVVKIQKMFFRIAKKMRREKQDVFGNGCVKDDQGNLNPRKRPGKSTYDSIPLVC